MDVSNDWYLVAASLSFLLPAGLVLIGAAGLDAKSAWAAALGALAAIGLAGMGYWAVGFALHFGGVGLFYSDPALMGLVWEWSALPATWGSGWGMAGLSGWFLSGEGMTPAAFALFLAHLPWAASAALLPVLALRGRAPALACLVLALGSGAFLYPLAGNWVQGGGWLASLGRNLGVGHGMVDFGGAGSVFLMAAGVTCAALLVWLPRQSPRPLADPQLPTAHLPVLAVLGALLLPVGVLGWSWSNPIQAGIIGELGPLRGSVNSLLFVISGSLIPVLYTWFVTGESDPLMAARGMAAGAIAGLGAGPFVTPTASLLVGLLAGGTVPFVTFVVNRLLRLNDKAGIVSMTAIPALLGLISVGLFADGAVGAGWQNTGAGSYLGVTGQGVTGLVAAAGFVADFPGQLQAQVIGAVALLVWGFVLGSLICVPLAALAHGIALATGAEQTGEQEFGGSRSTAGGDGQSSGASDEGVDYPATPVRPQWAQPEPRTLQEESVSAPRR
ncbi:MAG: hypothetical protein DWI57_05005 [Chloroflexi bacterium]|nr:MAG: hypothetical protein DWI57_05005 [Chloroflexota bacterium]